VSGQAWLDFRAIQEAKAAGAACVTLRQLRDELRRQVEAHPFRAPEVNLHEAVKALLDAKGAPAVVGSDTSQAAAKAIWKDAPTLRQQVLELLRSVAAAHSGNGLTDEEMQVRLDMNASTQRPRRVELVQAGLVKDSGRRARTRSGRNAVVWVATKGNE
jgi:hypothetical protein